MWNLLLGVKDLRKNPSVSLRLPAPFSREPECKKPPLKRVTPHGVGRCPQGRGDRSVRGEPSSDGGGVLVESFAWCKRFTQKSLSQPTACQLSTRHALRVPFQGSLFLKKAAKQKEHLPQDRSRAEMLFSKQIGFTLLLRPFQHASARRLPDLRLHTNSVGRKSW